jgi:hypothetical protein
MRRPLGCLTGTAIITALVATILFIVADIGTANGIFSPGRLNAAVGATPIGGVTSHAELESRCGACHAAPWSGQRMADLCLACHTDVAHEIAADDGLHGPLRVNRECRGCHTDHRGAAASVTLADLRGFPHERTGYALTAHPLKTTGGTFVCADCHTARLASFAQQTCLDCHARLDPAAMTPHVDTFGRVCLACHDGKDSYGASFAHSVYPLVGRHEGATCGACHRGQTALAAVRGTPTACVACHASDDAHGGRLGTSCEACHTPTAWSDATFDHNKTAFPLTGAHTDVSCERCHVGGAFKGTATACAACHARPASHLSSFTDCASCHATGGWRPATFTLSHAFPMGHGGAGGTCTACHPSTWATWSCARCHPDATMNARHAGVAGYSVSGCIQCHPRGGGD